MLGILGMVSFICEKIGVYEELELVGGVNSRLGSDVFVPRKGVFDWLPLVCLSLALTNSMKAIFPPLELFRY
jgi:hypothetical protein